MSQEFINKIKTLPTYYYIDHTLKSKITDVYHDGVLIWSRDKVAPTLALDKLGIGDGSYDKPYFSVTKEQVISGKAIDGNSGMDKVLIDGNTAAINSSTGKFSYTKNLTVNTKTPVTIKAYDKAGNLTEKTVYFYIDNTKKKVLQVYPYENCANQLYTWMVTNGYGKGMLDISSVAWDTFMANPYAYTRAGYDCISFGTWDSNASKQFNQAGMNATIEYINNGYGVICGHDIILENAGHSFYHGAGGDFNVSALASYFGLGSPRTSAPWNNSTTVKITKTGLFTTYPWSIGEAGTVLTIPQTHNVGQYVSDGTIWLQFEQSGATPLGMTVSNDNTNFYLVTKNNCAMIMTGHSNGEASVDEQKIWANLLFYLCLRKKSKDVCGVVLE